jgi:hypothetical protein
MDNDLNFNPRAQAAFDNLNDATDWTWSGIAKAFARRYDRPDLTEFLAAIELEIEAKDEQT